MLCLLGTVRRAAAAVAADCMAEFGAVAAVAAAFAERLRAPVGKCRRERKEGGGVCGEVEA